jgi:hypothetical protein
MKTTAARLATRVVSALTLSAVGVAHSQEPAVESTNAPYELTGYVGYQTGGEFEVEGTDERADVDAQVSYAVAMNFRAENEGQYQVYYSRQPAHVDATSEFPNGVDVDIDYLHFGGTLRLDPGSLMEPYIVGSVGATLLSAHFPDADDNQVFSVGVGAGLRIPVQKHFNLLLEARAFFSFMPSGGAMFCSSNQTGAGCRFHGSGSTFTQYVVMLGASFPF